MNRILYTALILMFCIGSKAQTKQWTLQECMQYASEHSPRVNRQKAQNSIYQQDYLNAIGRLIPSLNANTNANLSFGRGVDSETNTYTDVNYFSNSYSVYSSLTIFDGFSNINKIKMQKVNKLAGKQQLDEAKEMVAYETMEAFYNVLYYKKMSVLAQEQLDESTANMKQIKRMEELGMKALPDLAEMTAKEASDLYNLTKQNNLLKIGIILLKEKMNFPIGEAFEIADAVTNELVIKANETAQSIYEKAKATNPKALSAQSALKVQEYGFRSTVGNFSPTIGLEAGLSTSFVKYLDESTYIPFSEQLKNKQGSYIGLSLSIPIFNAFAKTSNYNRSKAQVAIAQTTYDETLRTLYSEIEQAIADMNGQADAYQLAIKQREAMETAHKANQRKYTEGLISSLELHTSANRVMQAKAEETNAELQYMLKARLVRYFKGESFNPPTP